MDKIELSNLHFYQNNNVSFEAENNIILKSGCKIYGDNSNNIVFKTGNVCEDKETTFNSKYSFYNSASVLIAKDSSMKSNFEETFPEDSFSINIKEKNKLICEVFPNPNNGYFYVNISDPTSMDDFIILDLMGRKINYSVEKINNIIRIKMQENFEGLVFLHYYNGNEIKVVKIIVK